MKRWIAALLALTLMLSFASFAETLLEEPQDIEEVVEEVTLPEEPETEPLAACTHANTKTVRTKEQTDCHEMTVTEEIQCKNCGQVLSVSDHTEYNSVHLGPYYYDDERHDGVDYIVKHCKHCDEEISKKLA